MNDGIKSTGAVALAGGGIAAAFALASCCAIPLFLAAAGLGAGWLLPIVSASQPHTGTLTAVSAVALLGSVGLVARPPKACEPGSLCARPCFRWTVVAAAVLGAALLVLSKLYA
jgi:mercuric ion transport protein